MILLITLFYKNTAIQILMKALHQFKVAKYWMILRSLIGQHTTFNTVVLLRIDMHFYLVPTPFRMSDCTPFFSFANEVHHHEYS